MSYRNNKKSSPPPNPSIFTGVLIGATIGIAIAAGLAWYILKTPGFFKNAENKNPEKVVAKANAAKPAVAATPTAPASAVSASKPRFEFYKELTDNSTQTASKAVPKNTDKPAAQAFKNELYYLQVGSFSNAGDADKLKAKLALMGMEAAVQVASIPDKGVWHRVRLGPYQGQSEANQARATLKLNGVEATPMRAQ